MDVILYKTKKSYSKYIFSFLLSHIICSLILGSKYILDYLLIPINSMLPQYFFSIEMFYFYIRIIFLLLVQSSIISILNFIIDIIFMDTDYKNSEMYMNNIKISQENYLKYLIFKSIPIFSVINFMSIPFHKNNLSLLENLMHINYPRINTGKFTGRLVSYLFKIIIIVMIIQFTGSSIMMINDPSKQLISKIKDIEVVKDAKTNLIIDGNSGNLVYNLTIYLNDGYIHYNKLTYAKEHSIESFKKTYLKIKKSIKNKVGEISVFNVVFYNDYTKTWDKFMYDENFDKSYELTNISSDIKDVDIYIQNNTLTYNLLTNISKDKIGWDIAEFMLSEFEDDIVNVETQNTIKTIVNSEEIINKYVVNILSKEYYETSENVYYTYIKHPEDKDWYYYDNRFYTIQKKEKAFESKVKEYISDTFTIDFNNAYNKGELLITIDNSKLTEKDINNIYDNINRSLISSDEGKDIVSQIKYVGKSNNIILQIKTKEEFK